MVIANLDRVTDNDVWLVVQWGLDSSGQFTGDVVRRFAVHGGLVPILMKYPQEYTLSYIRTEKP